MDRQALVIGGSVVLVVLVALAAGATQNSDAINFGKGKVAVIQLNGAVAPTASSGLGATSVITPETVRELNEDAKNRGADAIIYEINSGGGAVVASKEVMREIDSVEMPTVCRFRDIAASGAYLFSLGCDRIISDSASLTGSIGVRSSYLEFSGLLNKLGIEYVNVTAGEYKDFGSRYRNATPQERQMLERKAERVHQEFISLVEQNRNLTDEELNRATTGEPFLGERAKELKLVDKLGGRQTAVSTAENMTDKELETFKVERAPSFNFLSLFTADLPFKQFLSTTTPIRAEY